MVFSGDGARLAISGVAGGANHVLQVWDTTTGKLLGEYRGHERGSAAPWPSPPTTSTLASVQR